MNVSV